MRTPRDQLSVHNLLLPTTHAATSFGSLTELRLLRIHDGRPTQHGGVVCIQQISQPCGVPVVLFHTLPSLIASHQKQRTPCSNE